MKRLQSLSSRLTASVLVFFILTTTGILYQWGYHSRKTRYEKVITGYYREYLGREPDAIGLRHWTTWALNKWSLEKIRFLGFEEVRRKGLD